MSFAVFNVSIIIIVARIERKMGSVLDFISSIVFIFLMARPLRLEFPGALYHITSRGNARQEIFLSDDDRTSFLNLLGREVEQLRWRCYAYCLMGEWRIKGTQPFFFYVTLNTDVKEKLFVRVDATEEFPFLVTKMSPYYDR